MHLFYLCLIILLLFTMCKICYENDAGVVLLCTAVTQRRYLNESLSAFSQQEVTWMINELLC